MKSGFPLCPLWFSTSLLSPHDGLIRHICVIPADSAVGFCPRVYAQSFPFHAAAHRQLASGSHAGDFLRSGGCGFCAAAGSDLLPSGRRSSLRDERRDDEHGRRGLPMQQSLPDAAGTAAWIFADSAARLAISATRASPSIANCGRSVVATRDNRSVCFFPRSSSRVSLSTSLEPVLCSSSV